MKDTTPSDGTEGTRSTEGAPSTEGSRSTEGPQSAEGTGRTPRREAMKGRVGGPGAGAAVPPSGKAVTGDAAASGGREPDRSGAVATVRGDESAGTPRSGGDAKAAERAGTPGGSAGHASGLLPQDECDKFSRRLRHAVGGFVDGPRDAVAEADHLLEELANRFTEAVAHRRRTLRTSWQPGDQATAATATTEDLRLALCDYREMTERLLRL